MPEGFPPFAV